MNFNKLRLVGFKSFVEPTELTISPGMTGVVGPNGCGKSNLVEALRWVMGETSPRNMRGGEMDDVIFAGSATRPARNQAEVQLTLENPTGSPVPAAYSDAPEITVSRKITRESGSDYRLNGGHVRARDVQLLFADLATGARSTAIVSQGRIGALIGAKPAERRLLLEEAAGITGLHSRRHEAELRLRGAETNLERLDDVTGQLDGQLSGLKRQARQASRYRNLSDAIRQAEAIIHHLRYTAALAALNKARDIKEAAEAVVTETTRAAAAASALQAETVARIEPLRKAEVEAAAALQRLLLARESLDQEEARVRQTITDLQDRVGQFGRDLERETRRQTEAGERVAALSQEAGSLHRASAGQDDLKLQAEQAVDVRRTTLAEAETALSAATEHLAELRARRQALSRRLADETARRDDLSRRVKAAEQELARTGDQGLADRISAAERAEMEARAVVDAVAAEIASTEAARVTAEEHLNGVIEAERTAKSASAALETELTTLTRLLARDAKTTHAPVIDQVQVTPGFETAFATALGEGVQAALQPDAPAHWMQREPADLSGVLPDGATPLSVEVDGPAALARRLASVGVVADRAAGDALAPVLKPGQRLVSRAGDLWRWDGFVRRAGKQAAGAVRLEQQNRQRAVRQSVEPARASLRDAEQAVAKAREAVAGVIGAERSARARRGEAEQRIAKAGQALVAMRRQADGERQKRERLAAALESLRRDGAAAATLVEALTAEFAALPQTDGAERAQADARSAVDTARQAVEIARQGLEKLDRERRFRQRRGEEIAREVADWGKRAEEAATTVAELSERRDAARQALSDIAKRPDTISSQRADLVGRIESAEAARSEAVKRLTGAEATLAESDRELRSVQAALQTAREDHVRKEGAVEMGVAELQRLTREISDAMECPPGKVLEAGGLADDVELPDLRDAERSHERLKRERENMGPVNLRAEIEAQEVAEKLDTLTSERADLEAAIQRLRQGISAINKEARARLLEAFELVNGHFTQLFQRVFGGGEARLALTEADDPLQAGLEIMASPPGKRMQILTLLSGGEQALTATALLFAVFLTNPAPICVLDEIDAPLDDANVERLMLLIEDLAARGGTRFLVITHNPITMARMDRLFGVTMAERGVSQLVSVDLAEAAALRETA
ncbi:MAG: chromosome segregation protein SMC [Minwuia sp.]|nr:chromosome segregation protein SMC [Minwuia sp.]